MNSGKNEGIENKDFIKVELLSRTETRISDCWKRFATERTVYVNSNFAPISAVGRGGPNDYFAIAADTVLAHNKYPGIVGWRCFRGKNLTKQKQTNGGFWIDEKGEQWYTAQWIGGINKSFSNRPREKKITKIDERKRPMPKIGTEAMACVPTQTKFDIGM